MSHLFYEIGGLVRHREAPDWGVGQIQSILPDRITVNFENTGKVVIMGDLSVLDPVDPDTES